MPKSCLCVQSKLKELQGHKLVPVNGAFLPSTSDQFAVMWIILTKETTEFDQKRGRNIKYQ